MKTTHRLRLGKHRSDKQRQEGRRQIGCLDSLAPVQTSSERTIGCALRAAFATGDFRSIRSAVDEEVRRAGIMKVAESAKIDRTTIYRAFRCENGPTLDTMTKVLHVLGCRLLVELKPDASSKGSRLEERRTAHSLTLAFGSGDLDLVVGALAEALRAQENVSELARRAVLSRENLYRSFAFPRIPRFRTVLSFLDALGLRLGIEPLPSQNGPVSQPRAGRQGRKGGRSTQGDDLGRGARRRRRNCAP